MEIKPRRESTPFIVSGYVDFNSIRLIDQNGQFHNDVKIGQAKNLAKQAGLDLVCLNYPDQKNLALCKIIDYGKWKYSNDKKKKQNKVKKKETKEIRFSMSISDHDIEHKMRQVRTFLEEGNDVLFSMRLKGRERAHFKDAEEKMNNIVSICEEGKEVSRKATRGNIMVRMSKAIKSKEAK